MPHQQPAAHTSYQQYMCWTAQYVILKQYIPLAGVSAKGAAHVHMLVVCPGSVDCSGYVGASEMYLEDSPDHGDEVYKKKCDVWQHVAPAILLLVGT